MRQVEKIENKLRYSPNKRRDLSPSKIRFDSLNVSRNLTNYPILFDSYEKVDEQNHDLKPPSNSIQELNMTMTANLANRIKHARKKAEPGLEIHDQLPKVTNKFHKYGELIFSEEADRVRQTVDYPPSVFDIGKKPEELNKIQEAKVVKPPPITVLN